MTTSVSYVWVVMPAVAEAHMVNGTFGNWPNAWWLVPEGLPTHEMKEHAYAGNIHPRSQQVVRFGIPHGDHLGLLRPGLAHEVLWAVRSVRGRP